MAAGVQAKAGGNPAPEPRLRLETKKHNGAARDTTAASGRVQGVLGLPCTTEITKMKINHKSTILVLSALLLTGCASVNMASKEESDKAKQFSAPATGKSGLYVYRNSFVGKALKKDIWVNGNCLGESAADVFFYTQVDGGKKNKIKTESEFSPNSLEVSMDAGKNYFVRQFIKMGAFVGGADLEQIPEEQGKADVAKLGLAQSGTCGK